MRPTSQKRHWLRLKLSEHRYSKKTTAITSTGRGYPSDSTVSLQLTKTMRKEDAFHENQTTGGHPTQTRSRLSPEQMDNLKHRAALITRGDRSIPDKTWMNAMGMY